MSYLTLIFTVMGQISPYAGPCVNIRFREEKNFFHIPRAFLQDQPWVNERNNYKFKCGEEVGHVLIHFLFTGEYQILETDETKTNEDIIMDKLRIAVQVLLEGRVWKLPLLPYLVQSEIKSLSRSIHIFDAVRLVDERLEECTLQFLSWRKEWLKQFLMDGLKDAFENDTADFENLSLFNKLKNIDLIKFLAENLFKICYSQIAKSHIEIESPNLDSESVLTLTPKTTSSNEDSKDEALN
ncbi:hypothetical protein OnM2_079028 [Erysiphe neolycopersici]|uniref:Uncharacterized protein n=1 Tax=Erysiphe neolycopersici TaxID=212602 RepID=A0A420HGX7_9PEZI|nr:hypothetical protein OnM2_079028 [Erysiphe neolycopersici]